MIDIPSDLRDFLTDTDSLVVKMPEGEVRKVKLYALSELRSDSFDVVDDSTDERASFDGFGLTKDADDYDPTGILVWFPSLKEYGAWDSDHHKIITFPKTTWATIISEPTRYFNAQWYPEEVPHRSITPQTKG